MNYYLKDDCGFWCAVPMASGRYHSMEEAAAVALERNVEACVVHLNGELITAPTEQQMKTFTIKHLRHPECTCSKMSKKQLDAKLAEKETCDKFDPDAHGVQLSRAIRKLPVARRYGR